MCTGVKGRGDKWNDRKKTKVEKDYFCLITSVGWNTTLSIRKSPWTIPTQQQ